MQMEWLQVWGFFGLFLLTGAQKVTSSFSSMSPPQSSSPTYLLLVPRTLRPGVPTTLSVSILSVSPVTVLAEIIPHSESSYWRPYQLEVRGYVGKDMVFTNTTTLRFHPKNLSTFIQTDKMNYLPGQGVKIRAVSIHPDGKPYSSPVDIVIKDPRGNMVRQWLSLDSVLGVVSKEFELSDNPPLGEWTVVTSVSGVFSEKYFNVAHYVLPKFEVLIEAPAVVYHEDSLWGSVTAKYMYGKAVQGHMNITYLHRFHGIEVVYHEHKEIDGAADFMFDLPVYEDMAKRSVDMYYEGYMDDEVVTIVVHVTEYLTGLTYNSTETVSLVKCKYKLAFDGYPTVIRPSLNFTAKLKISMYNDQPLPLEDQGKTVTVSVMQRKRSPWTLTWEESEEFLPRMANLSEPSGSIKPLQEMPVQMELPVPPNGVIPLFIQLLDEIETLTIDASFEDAYKTLQLYSSYSSPSRSYLQIQKPSASPQVKSRGQIVSAGNGSPSLILTPEHSWAPLAHIVVYWVRPDGEVINDALQLPITQVLMNQVSVSWSQGSVRPADQVSLSVSVAEPGSLVGILVVDKATRSARSHSDITTETVLEEMADYSVEKEELPADGMRMGDPYSVFSGQEPRERWNFPETWLWLNTNTGNSTTAEMTVTVPDSITTWTASAFVMSENLGLGILQTPAELTVFQDFFMSLNLPAFIIRGEELVLEVYLYNYLPQDLMVVVIVAESESFEFIFPDSEGLAMASTRQLSVGSQTGTSVLFPIKPLVLGEIPISVKARSSVASDAIRKMVLVKPEGLEQSFSTTLFLELTPSEASLSKDITFTFPTDVVQGSERAQLTAVGDILGPSITGLESLIQMPYGCGEQNMIHFAPNIYILQYLTVSGGADQDTVEKATSYMMKGYERELSYQREDGSFSAFGDSDSSGSTWLSAFVLRCFLQARPFISMDQMVLLRAAAWLGAQQGADGRFEEPGRVIHTELQGGLDGPLSLTAYVLMALLEDDVIKSQYQSQVSGALLYLETRLSLGISSNYSLCLVTYALTLAASSSADYALTELMGRAEMRDGVPFWSSSEAGLSASWQPRSADIEMAAYLLLSLRRLDRVAQGLALMKWLSQQRNHLGGYGSTQDTVVALQALSAYAAFTGTDNLNVTIRVNTEPSNTVAIFHIDHTNYLLHQSQQIDTEEELNLQVKAEGQGFALFQLNVFYNIDNRRLSRRERDTNEHEAFHLDIELLDLETSSSHLYICTRLLEGRGLNKTGMAIMEVGLLSGFSLAQEGIQTNHFIKKVETSDGKVNLYLDSVSTMEMCVELPLVLEFKVAKVQDATVLIYDYYEPRRRTVRSYTSDWRRDMSTCSFCGDDCSQCMGGGHYMSGSTSHADHRHLVPHIYLQDITTSPEGAPTPRLRTIWVSSRGHCFTLNTTGRGISGTFYPQIYHQSSDSDSEDNPDSRVTSVQICSGKVVFRLHVLGP
ncbi:CD109 antigen [Polymixia lowei]